MVLQTVFPFGWYFDTSGGMHLIGNHNSVLLDDIASGDQKYLLITITSTAQLKLVEKELEYIYIIIRPTRCHHKKRKKYNVLK